MTNIKKKSKIKRLVRNVFMILVGILLFIPAINFTLTKYEQATYNQPGELIEVNGKKMHVYSRGEGDHTILLMPGLGTAAPVLDFEPLIDKLVETNKVVVVEPFGYGWSDLADNERSVENIVEEIRTALKNTEQEGPYILMPHSISGIYSMYFANTYPEEVEAVIGIDPTLPQMLDYYGETAPTMPRYLSYLAPTGIARIALTITPDSFLPIAEKGVYSEENLTMTKAISTWNGYNRSVVAEANEIKANIEKTKDMGFPEEKPVVVFTPEKDKVTFYETQLPDKSASKVVLLEGHHYLHWSRFEEMSKEVSEFLDSLSEGQ